MSQNTYEICLEKSLSFLLVWFLLAIFDWRSVIVIYAILGQGHFFMAYYYQFKAGRMNRVYLGKVLVFTVVVLGSYSLYPNHEILAIVTAVLFLQHALFDESTLLRLSTKGPMTWDRFLEMLPILLLYSALLVDGILAKAQSAPTLWLSQHLPSLSPIAAIASAVVLLYYSWRAWKIRNVADGATSYFFLLGLALTGYLFFAMTAGVSVVKLMGFVILFHYFNWYGFYGHKLARANSGLKGYLGLFVLVNGALVTVYLLSRGGTLVWLSSTLFSEDAFYLWTLLHLWTSFRPEDLAFLGGRKEAAL